ncbi:hypothetical protein N7474_003985 [Penicillium riverlandense]|uniref:uncharacterized protein n=1 Tax=Penicillium riverlandense TaxID=1903569 RepID=UPI002549AE87|nr:uncharacterized protein N7474_003985 [Penicillium riverlandense]KAJ5818394.1 hypothetical protein N7474_003985 [Penicillium riverlandense]
MQFTQLFLSTLFASSAVLAAPVSMMASSPEWTIKDMKRVCNAADTECTWTFGIEIGKGAITECTYVEKGTDASQIVGGGPSTCGKYTITSNWSGQFGKGQGFTTLAVVDNPTSQIIYPAYKDTQLVNGTVVKPDQSYAPAALP